MKTILTLAHRAGRYQLDCRGRFGGGYQGRQVGTTPEEAAVNLAMERGRYGDTNPDGCEIVAPPEVLAALANLTVASGEQKPGQPSGERRATAQIRRTISLTHESIAALGLGDEDNWSGTINAMAVAWRRAADGFGFEVGDDDALASVAVRYRALLDEACPALTRAQWCYLADALNGSVRTAEHAELDPARWLGDSVRDAAPDGLPEKWDVDADALATRLDALPYAARVAVIEVVERFWRMASGEVADTGETLRAAGARMASGERKSEQPSGEPKSGMPSGEGEKA